MPIASREDPFKSHSFLVEIDGIASAFFKSVSGLDAEVEVIELRSIEELVTRKLPGRVRFSNVRLERGLTTSRDLFDWWAAVLDGAVDRRGVAIMLLDDSRRPVLRWELQQAWPVKWEISELDAAKNEVAIETIELAHEGFRLVD
jgi:phage tail-like protein